MIENISFIKDKTANTIIVRIFKNMLVYIDYHRKYFYTEIVSRLFLIRHAILFNEINL